MGAIVGGLYAMGMPVDELERMTTQVDWNEIFTDDIPRSSEVYRRKSDRNYYLSSIDFDLEHGVRLPMGIITGKRIDLFLRSLALNAPDDFDTFPIPFRAVASDIVTGQQVVLSKRTSPARSWPAWPSPEPSHRWRSTDGSWSTAG